MFGVGPSELIIILVLALIIFGPGKLPEVGKAIGRSIREFKAASSQVEEGIKQSISVTPTPAQTGQAAPAQASAEASTTTAQSEPVVDGQASS